MDNTVYIDYCSNGKGRSFFPRISGEGLEVHSMYCMDSCDCCRTQFRADVTYMGKTQKIAEDTASDFMNEAKKRMGLDLSPYLQNRNRYTKSKGKN